MVEVKLTLHSTNKKRKHYCKKRKQISTNPENRNKNTTSSTPLIHDTALQITLSVRFISWRIYTVVQLTEDRFNMNKILSNQNLWTKKSNVLS